MQLKVSRVSIDLRNNIGGLKVLYNFQIIKRMTLTVSKSPYIKHRKRLLCTWKINSSRLAIIHEVWDS
jgi:hypothetical protein